MNYNLLEEKWIPVLWKDGITDRVGILQALKQAHRIRQIAASNPMDWVAILRFLLALLYWCQRKSGGVNAPCDGLIPGEWINILHDHNQLFDLLRGPSVFYQDLDARGNVVAASNLLHDLPSGTNIAHFRHIRDFRAGLCLPCCALGLLRWPSVASASKKGKYAQMTACIHGNRPAYFILNGANLLKTIWVNWPSGLPVNGDVPVWDGADEDSQLGFLKGMTWRSRQILLAPPNEQGHRDFSFGYCCYCGDQTNRLVKSIRFNPGWPRPSKEPWWDDPYLLRVDIKDNKGKIKKNSPFWPSPNDPLEDFAVTWRYVLTGLLQSSDFNSPVPTQFHNTLVGTSQELYKHAETVVTSIPGLDPSIIQVLLNELEWLKEVTGKTTSGRTKEWEKRPRGHVVIDALCSPAGKGQAIRSGLCSLSFLAEMELKKAFEKLIQKFSFADLVDADAHAQLLKNWREQVCEVIHRNVEKGVDFTAPGSPLRRREAMLQANEAVRKLI